MIKAIIFDLDNTLIDFMTMKNKSVEGAIAAMRDAGLKISDKNAEKILFKLYGIYGIEYQKIFQVFLKQVQGKVDYKLLTNAIVGYRKVQRKLMRTYPNVKSTLEKLKKKGIVLAILTDAPRIRAWLRLAELGLTDYFDHVVCFEDTHIKKPNKKPFVLMLKKLNLNPKDVLMVGDSLNKDIAGAKSLGMITCYAKYGEIGFKTKEKVKPDYVIHSIEKIIDIVGGQQNE